MVETQVPLVDGGTAETHCRGEWTRVEKCVAFLYLLHSPSVGLFMNLGGIKEIRWRAKKFPGTSWVSPWTGHRSDQKIIFLLVSSDSTRKDPAPEFRLVTWTTRANWRAEVEAPQTKEDEILKPSVLFLPWL